MLNSFLSLVLLSLKSPQSSQQVLHLWAAPVLMSAPMCKSNHDISGRIEHGMLGQMCRVNAGTLQWQSSSHVQVCCC